MGSSVAMGERVPIENTFATLVPAELSRPGRPKVELYNEAMGFGFPRNTALRFNDVLAAKPNLILWALTLIDVKLAGFLYPENPSKKLADSSSPHPGLMGSLKNSMIETVREHAGNPVAASLIALRHFVYEHESQDQYIASYLTLPSGAEGFWDAGPQALRADLSPEWQVHLKEFERRAADVEGMAKAAGVPLVAVLLPNRAQAAMISKGEWPPDFDPYKLDDELRRIITSHGGIYIDILPDFRAIPDAERHYYPLDGHPDAAGHAVIAEFLAKELSGGAIPELGAAVEPHVALETGN